MDCPICVRGSATKGTATDAPTYTCKVCGGFFITPSAEAVNKHGSPTVQQRRNASSWLRQNPGYKINSENVNELFSKTAPSVSERAMLFLLHLERVMPSVGDIYTIDLSQPSVDEWFSVTWSSVPQELIYLADKYLAQLNLIQCQIQASLIRKLFITPAGFERIEKYKSSNAKSQIGFCAMWFDKGLDCVWSEAIEPAICDAGYEPLRIDKHQHNNRVDDEIITVIRRSKFVVSDMTGGRGGVYFEAGFAYGLGIPIIWTCRDDYKEKVHFDTRQFAMTFWTDDKLADFRKALAFRIEATLTKGSYRRPPKSPAS